MVRGKLCTLLARQDVRPPQAVRAEVIPHVGARKAGDEIGPISDEPDALVVAHYVLADLQMVFHLLLLGYISEFIRRKRLSIHFATN